MENVLVAAHNRRDGDDVIDFGRVFQSKHEPDAEDGQHAEGANVFQHSEVVVATKAQKVQGQISRRAVLLVKLA